MHEKTDYIGWAREVLLTEAQGLHEIADSINQDFADAVAAVLQCTGRVVVTGIGKSGHIGRKIAATLASTGTPAFFVHPAEAAHGDLGMIVDGDVVIALSNSGESDELTALLPALKRKAVCLIGITSRPLSTIAQHADIHIKTSVSQEACPLGLAPTSSTTAVLALGDALAVALLRARSFTPDDFALSHPAGSLGKRLLLRVGDIMRSGSALPVAHADDSLRSGILTMSVKGIGMVAIADNEGCLKGIFTDGDLRRIFEKYDNVSHIRLGDVMHENPYTIDADKLATEALKRMETHKIGCLLVTDSDNRLIGAVSMHDLLAARIA